MRDRTGSQVQIEHFQDLLSNEHTLCRQRFEVEDIQRVLTLVLTLLEGVWRARDTSDERISCRHVDNPHLKLPHPQESSTHWGAEFPVMVQRKRPLRQRTCTRRQVRYRSDVTRTKGICENDVHEKMDCW